jgi:uncharacterized protein (DUF2141 family)
MLQASLAPAADLRIEVSGVESPSGKIVVSVYKTAESFLKTPDASAAVAASVPGVVALIRKLEPGEYAVSVYQDLNGNGQIDRSMFGIPKEPNGASNNAREKLGPPKFEQAKFKVGSADLTISLTLHP